MIRHGEPGGWQVTLADLSLILFATAAHGAGAGFGPVAASRAAAPSPQTSIAAGDQDYERWLAVHLRDPRQQLTITATYEPREFDDVMGRANALALAARARGFDPRITIQPATATDISATFAFDRHTGTTP